MEIFQTCGEFTRVSPKGSPGILDGKHKKIVSTDGKTTRFSPEIWMANTKNVGFCLNFGALGNKLGITLNSSVTRKRFILR